jgi:hypothetical protein
LRFLAFDFVSAAFWAAAADVGQVHRASEPAC